MADIESPDRVGVRVWPDTRNFLKDLRATLNRVEKQVKANVPVVADSALAKFTTFLHRHTRMMMHHTQMADISTDKQEWNTQTRDEAAHRRATYHTSHTSTCVQNQNP